MWINLNTRNQIVWHWDPYTSLTVWFYVCNRRILKQLDVNKFEYTCLPVFVGCNTRCPRYFVCNLIKGIRLHSYWLRSACTRTFYSISLYVLFRSVPSHVMWYFILFASLWFTLINTRNYPFRLLSDNIYLRRKIVITYLGTCKNDLIE